MSELDFAIQDARMLTLCSIVSLMVYVGMITHAFLEDMSNRNKRSRLTKK